MLHGVLESDGSVVPLKLLLDDDEEAVPDGDVDDDAVPVMLLLDVPLCDADAVPVRLLLAVFCFERRCSSSAT